MPRRACCLKAAKVSAPSNGSAIITSIPSTANYTVGMQVTGAGIPSGATIASIDSTTQIHISANATATATGILLTIGTPILVSLPAINAQISNPASTVARGYVVFYTAQVVAADQTTLNQMAINTLIQMGQYFQSIVWEAPVMPFHDDNDCYTLTNSQAGLSYTYVESVWQETYSGDPGSCQSQHTCQRAVSLP